jgi:hypothetical protein
MTMLSPIGQLAVLLVRADEQDRTSARQIEDAAEEAATKDANDRVAQIRSKADAERDGAFASGIAEIAGGAFAVGAAFFPAANDGDHCSQPSAADRRFDWNAALNGCAKALPGVGTMFGGQYKGVADRDDADAARFEAQSQADIRRYDRAQSDAQAADQSIQRVEQFLEQTQQTENATRLAAATFRA